MGNGLGASSCVFMPAVWRLWQVYRQVRPSLTLAVRLPKVTPFSGIWRSCPHVVCRKMPVVLATNPFQPYSSAM